MRWLARVLDPNNKEFEYKISGPQQDEGQVAEFIRTYYRNVTFVSARRDPASDHLHPHQPPPGANQIPASHYQCGAMAAAQAELMGGEPPPRPTLKRVLIPRTLIRR